MNYLDSKRILIEKLKQLDCNLLRDGNDVDFGLLDKNREEDVYKLLIAEGFICTSRDSSMMNFKKFICSKLMDVDIAINTKYLRTYFYDIEIKKEFEKMYFKDPKKHKLAMNTVRYFMLLRAREKKYKEFIYLNRVSIEKNNLYLDLLTKTPFKKSIDFDNFMAVMQVNPIALILYVKLKYIFHFIKLKLQHMLQRSKGKVIAIDGVDGAGKSTVIDILTKELNKPSYYMGERGFRYAKFYKKKKFFLLKPLSLIGQYTEKAYRAFRVKKLSNDYDIVFCDRYHSYSKTATSNSVIDMFNRLFFYFYPKPTKLIILWNEPDVILSRKEEVTKKYIEHFNENKEQLYKGAVFIKNDDIDETLNRILKEIYV